MKQIQRNQPFFFPLLLPLFISLFLCLAVYGGEGDRGALVGSIISIWDRNRAFKSRRCLQTAAGRCHGPSGRM